MQKLKDFVLRIFPVQTHHVLKYSFVFTFIFGIVAHGYCFFNGLFSHDNLVINADTTEELWKLTLGRYLVPVYRSFRGGLALPLLIGVISLVWISLAVYFCCRFFDISKLPSVAAFSVVMTVNLTVVSQASGFLYELDFDMLALLCAVLAAYCWKCGGMTYWLAPVFVFASLGLYQAYVAVTITLMMLYSIISLANSENAKSIIVKGLKGIAALLMGAAVYALGLLLVARIFGTSYESGVSNSLTHLFADKNRLMWYLIKEAFVCCVKQWLNFSGVRITFLRSANLMTVVCTVLLALVPTAILALTVKKKIKPLNFSLICLLGALLPFGMNCIWILNNGYAHHLTRFAFWFIWLLPLLITETPSFKNSFKAQFQVAAKATVAICLVLIAFTNIQTANSVYLKKQLEAEETLSVLTDVSRLMHDTEGYSAGETTVTFVGTPTNGIYGFEKLYDLTGNYGILATTYAKSYENYFKYYFNEKLNAAEITSNILAESDKLAAMPCYPDRGCVGYVGDVLVVKFSEYVP